MPTNVYDVVVVGGGPAGAMAAYELAKKSLKVALLEKARLPRYKACAGVVAPRVERILDFSIEPTIERRITKMMITVKLGSPFISQAPHPFAYLVMRGKFDNYLVEMASRAGAEVYEQSPLTGLIDAQGSYLLTTPTREFRARYIIGADGANSVTRKLIGAPRFQRLAIAIEREIPSTPELLEKWRDTIALDFGQLASGYAWIFPKAANFSVGAGGPKSVAKQLESCYRATVNHYQDQIGNARPYREAGHYLPIRVPKERLVYGRTLLVGDAAGLIEPMAGEGIYYAMRSAQIAAETIRQAIRFDDGYLPGYQKKIDQEIQPELQVAKSLLFLLDKSPQFWVPRLLRQSHPFWQYFYRVFTGEQNYKDLPGKFGLLGQLIFVLLARDVEPYI